MNFKGIMEYTKFILFVLMSLPSPIFRTACGSQQKALTDLSRFKVEGVTARLVVDREALEQVLQSKMQQDPFCGQNVKLQLPQSLPLSAYNTSHEGEMILAHGTITDHTLATELSNDLKEQFSTSHTYLSVFIPVVIGTNEKHGLLSLRVFTDSKKKVLHPYLTNIREVTQVDSIEEEDDGTVRLRLGDDVIIYRMQEVTCNEGKNVGKDFDRVSGEIVTVTSYPLPFDWGCEVLGSQISFCQVLDEAQCELAAVGGDVCVEMSTSWSERSPASMKVVNMTGMFREMFPFLAETVPCESFEAEYDHREHTTGITFPCLTP